MEIMLLLAKESGQQENVLNIMKYLEIRQNNGSFHFADSEKDNAHKMT